MTTSADIPKPTAAELDLLQVLWPLGAATARQVHEAMQLTRPDVTYATVLRLMQKAFAGSAKALVLAALKSGISKKERAEIEQLLKDDKQ